MTSRLTRRTDTAVNPTGTFNENTHTISFRVDYLSDKPSMRIELISHAYEACASPFML